MSPRYSVVVPVFNESGALPSLADEIVAAMAPLRGGFECILVDDGSTDETGAIIAALTAAPASAFRCVHLSRNRGQAAALFIGLRCARGQVIVTLDGDGQNPPGDIPRLVSFLESHDLDLVCGSRVDRQDSAVRRGMSRIANAIRSRVLGDGLHDSGCGLKVMRREVVSALVPIRTLYSFVPALAVSAGFRVGECAVGHRSRRSGASSYGLTAFMWRPFVDMLGVRWYRARAVLERSDLVEDSARAPKRRDEDSPQTHAAGWNVAQPSRCATDAT